MGRRRGGRRAALSPRRLLQEGPRARPHASHRFQGKTSATTAPAAPPRPPARNPPALPTSPRLRPRPEEAGRSWPRRKELEWGAPRRGRAGPPLGGARTRGGGPGGGPAAALPVDLVREGAALGYRHGAPRVQPPAPPLQPRAPSPPWPPPPPPPGSGQPGLGGAGGGALPGVPGRSVLPLPAGGGAGPPGSLCALEAGLGKLRRAGEERIRD